MGILNPTTGQEKDSQKSARRKSGQPDFAKLGPLKPGGAAGFVNFRDNEKSGRKRSGKAGGSDLDSDDDDEDPKSIIGKAEDDEDKEGNPTISTDDASQQGELAEGVRQIKVGNKSPKSRLSRFRGWRILNLASFLVETTTFSRTSISSGCQFRCPANT